MSIAGTSDLSIILTLTLAKTQFELRYLLEMLREIWAWLSGFAELERERMSYLLKIKVLL